MGTTHQNLLEQLRVSKREIARRKQYFDLQHEDLATLASLYTLVADRLDPIVTKFYEGILPFSEMDRLIGDADTLAKLRSHLRSYILSLFGGEYDEEYVLSRLRIGLVHKRIGVAPKYYVSAVRNLGQALRDEILREHKSDPTSARAGLEALEKILMLDLSLVFDTYIHSLMEEVRRSQEELEHYAESLEEVISERTQRLKEQARHDGLTGLLNQTAFYDELRRELARGNRHGHPTTLIYFDLDGFKQLNDRLGHRQGDKLLVTVAKALQQSIRKGEHGARYGGDEFCIILPESTPEEAKILCHRIREEVEDQVREFGISCSMGIAVSTGEEPLDEATLVRQADEAMYLAKRQSGFSVCIAGEAVPAVPATPGERDGTDSPAGSS